MTWDHEALRLMHACYRLVRLRRHRKHVWGTADRKEIAERRRLLSEHPIAPVVTVDRGQFLPSYAAMKTMSLEQRWTYANGMSPDEFVRAMAQTNAYDPSKAFSATGLENCVDSKLDDPITPGTKMTMEQWHLRYIR